MKEAQEHYGTTKGEPLWIKKNIEKMIGQILRSARTQQPLPFSITMHPIALRAFIEMLKSQSAFFPNEDGSFSFLGIPVYANAHFPAGTFTVEKFDKKKGMLLDSRR